MEWHDLEKMTVVKLREDAHEKGMKGVHGLNKAQLLHGLAEILGIEKPHEELSDDVSHSSQPPPSASPLTAATTGTEA